MQAALAAVDSRFGALHGVIHAAGTLGPEVFQPVAETTREGAARLFRPKMEGLAVLEAVLGDRNLDMCLVVSSLSSVLGGVGFAAYAAANLYMDALVTRHNRHHPTPWISMNWDAWAAENMPAMGDAAELAIQPEEGVDAFQRIVARGGF